VEKGVVVAVSAAAKHGFGKTTRLSIVLVAGFGIEGDAHYGSFVRHRYLARRNPRAPNLRQVHLIPSETLNALRGAGYDVGRPRSRKAPTGHRAPNWRLSSHSACWPADAVRPHRSLSIRPKRPPDGRRARFAFQSRRHGDRDGEWPDRSSRPNPSHSSCSASLPAAASLRPRSEAIDPASGSWIAFRLCGAGRRRAGPRSGSANGALRRCCSGGYKTLRFTGFDRVTNRA
jgi:hypothetical protein